MPMHSRRAAPPTTTTMSRPLSPHCPHHRCGIHGIIQLLYCLYIALWSSFTLCLCAVRWWRKTPLAVCLFLDATQWREKEEMALINGRYTIFCTWAEPHCNSYVFRRSSLLAAVTIIIVQCRETTTTTWFDIVTQKNCSVTTRTIRPQK